MDGNPVDLIVTRLPGLHIHESSVIRHEEVLYFLVDTDDGQRQLAISTPAGSPHLADFEGVPSAFDEQTLLLCPLSAENAAALLGTGDAQAAPDRHGPVSRIKRQC